MPDAKYYDALIRYIDAMRDDVRKGQVNPEEEKNLVGTISEITPHLGKHIHYALLDKNYDRIGEILRDAQVLVFEEAYRRNASQSPIAKASRRIVPISRPLNEIFLSTLISTGDADALLGDLEERHDSRKSRAYWSDFLFAAFTLLWAKVWKAMRFEWVFKGNR